MGSSQPETSQECDHVGCGPVGDCDSTSVTPNMKLGEGLFRKVPG